MKICTSCNQQCQDTETVCPRCHGQLVMMTRQAPPVPPVMNNRPMPQGGPQGSPMPMAGRPAPQQRPMPPQQRPMPQQRPIPQNPQNRPMPPQQRPNFQGGVPGGVPVNMQQRPMPPQGPQPGVQPNQMGQMNQMGPNMAAVNPVPPTPGQMGVSQVGQAPTPTQPPQPPEQESGFVPTPMLEMPPKPVEGEFGSPKEFKAALNQWKKQCISIEKQNKKIAADNKKAEAAWNKQQAKQGKGKKAKQDKKTNQAAVSQQPQQGVGPDGTLPQLPTKQVSGEMSVKDWVIVFFIMVLPIYNIIYLFKRAFKYNNPNESVTNLFKAWFYLMLVSFIGSALCILLSMTALMFNY